MKSMRARLSLFLLLAAVFTALVIGTITYRNTLHESEKLFDTHLRQIAQSLRDQGEVMHSVLPYGAEENAADSVVQIWTNNGTVVYLSHPANPLPDQATLGFADVDAGNRRWRVFSMAAQGRIIQVAQPLELRRGRAAAAAIQSLTPLLAFAPLMALLIWWLVGNSLSPLKRLANELTQRDARTLKEVSEQGLPGEITPLVRSLNSLLVRLKQAFSSQSAFVADAAHELRSPLTALKLQLQLLDRAPDEVARLQALGKLHEGVDRATRLIEQLIAAARSDPNDTSILFQPVDLTELMRQSITDIFMFAQERRQEIALDATQPIMLQADAAALRILARNLLDNAIRYTPCGGVVHVSVCTSAGKILLLVEDSGPGVAEENRARVFDRFCRLESNDQTGSGLGLSIVKNIAEQHGARIDLDKSSLGGLKVSLWFALHQV